MTKDALVQVRVSREEKELWERAVPVMRERTGDHTIRNVASMIRYLLANSPSVKEVRDAKPAG